jgi:hypothetical protein
MAGRCATSGQCSRKMLTARTAPAIPSGLISHCERTSSRAAEAVETCCASTIDAQTRPAAAKTFASLMTVALGFATRACSCPSPFGHNVAHETFYLYGSTTVFALPSTGHCKLTTPASGRATATAQNATQ